MEQDAEISSTPHVKDNKDVKYLSDNLEFSENVASLFHSSPSDRDYISWEDHYQFDTVETLLTTGRTQRPAVSVHKPTGVKTHSCHFQHQLTSNEVLPPITKEKKDGRIKSTGAGKMASRKSTYSVRSIPMEPSVDWGVRIMSATNNFESVCLRSDSLAQASPDLSVSTASRADLASHYQVQEFITEWEMGHKPIHQKHDNLNENEILLENGVRFDKVLEPIHPPSGDQWQAKGQVGARVESNRGRIQGQRRWQEWPQPHKNAKTETWLSAGETRELELEREGQKKSLANKKLNKFGAESGTEQVDKASICIEEEFFMEEEKEFTPSNIVEEWLQLWNLPVLVSTVTPSDLLDQMKSVNNQLVKLQAAAQSGLLMLSHELTGSEDKLLLDQKLSRLLTDESLRVRITAATVLSLTTTADTSHLEGVLLEGAKSSDEHERWLSSQTLALMLIPHTSVLTELSHRMVSDVSRERSRALMLLGKLSPHSEVVHEIAAELVASVYWREKIAGCSLVPLVHSGPQRDVQLRLIDIMWHHWHSKVREAAARALGRSEKGNLVYDEIRDKLTDMENEDLRLDALHKIRELKPPMRLLVPGLLSCIEDDVVSIRLRCIHLVGEMQIRDERIVEALILQLKEDNWKVKLEAISALSSLSSTVSSPQEIVSQLLWAGRYDRMAVVRTSAIQTLSALAKEFSSSNFPELREQVVAALSESLSSDTEDSVREESRKGLVDLGEKAVQDVKHLLAIRDEIKRLGQPAEIAAAIFESS